MTHENHDSAEISRAVGVATEVGTVPNEVQDKLHELVEFYNPISGKWVS